jgi:phosphoglycerate kinase
MTTIVRLDLNETVEPSRLDRDHLVRRALQTIKPLLEQGETLVLLASSGQPIIAPRDTIHKIRASNPSLQFGPLATALATALDCSGEARLTSMPTVQLPAYRISDRCLLLENLRFDQREVTNDQVFGRQLAALGDRYLIDDFRALATRSSSLVSMVKAVPTRLSDRVRVQLGVLDSIRERPPRPFCLAVGGNQVARKFRLLRVLADSVDTVLVGGVVANTLLAANGIDVQRSLTDHAELDHGKQLLSILDHRLVLPIDFVWRAGRIMDPGPKSRVRFERALEPAAAVLMTGPFGVTNLQIESFVQSTLAVADQATVRAGRMSVAVGDDLMQTLDDHRRLDQFTHQIEGDTAAIGYLAGERLPALEALQSSRYAASPPVE